MKIFVDSADPKEIAEVLEWGIISGVTTNPSLYGKMKTDFVSRIKELIPLAPEFLFTQVIGLDNKEEMVRQARWLSDQSEKIVVKLPMSKAGIQALVQLRKERPDMKIAITAVGSVAQALLCGKCGATVVALFNGPLDTVSDGDFDMVTAVKKIYTNYGYKTKILSCCRFAPGVAEYAAAGTDYMTTKKEFLELLYEHPYTDKRMNGFFKDWRGAFGDKKWPEKS